MTAGLDATRIQVSIEGLARPSSAAGPPDKPEADASNWRLDVDLAVDAVGI